MIYLLYRLICCHRVHKKIVNRFAFHWLNIKHTKRYAFPYFPMNTVNSPCTKHVAGDEIHSHTHLWRQPHYVQMKEGERKNSPQSKRVKTKTKRNEKKWKEKKQNEATTVFFSFSE